MKVTDVKTFAVDCFRTNWVFVKVYTDEGIDGVGEAQFHVQFRAGHVGAVAQAVNFQHFGKTVRHAFNNVEDVGAGGAVNGVKLFFFPFRDRKRKHVIFEADGDIRRAGVRKRAQRAGGRHYLAVDFHFGFSGNVDDFFTNSAHIPPLPNLAQQFATHLGGFGLAIGHNAFRSRQNGNAKRTADFGNVVVRAVHPLTRFGDSSEPLDYAFVFRRVF